MVTSTLNVVGKAVARGEGPDKVSGATKYTADVLLPGMLFGKILRSPYAHARVVSVDVSGAWEVPGVRAVLTGADVAGMTQGKTLRDIPVLAWDRVRYIGDRVAAVAADSAEAAEEALLRIEVVYEELPAVFDPQEAMLPGAPVIHENLRDWPGSEVLKGVPDVPNAFSRAAWSHGDVDAGFRQSDLVIEETYRIPSRHVGYIEPHAGTVMIDAEGRVQAWMTTKSPFGTRDQLSNSIGLPVEQINVNAINIGGDFGGKGDALDLPIAYFLAKQSGLPVLMLMSYMDELQAGSAAHPTRITIKTGVTRDGSIVARQMTAIHDSGAYAGMKPMPNANIPGASQGGGSYRIPNTSLEAIQVYTNTMPRGHFRAPGAPQTNFAVESHMDRLAKELGMDPAAFRLKNVLREGDSDPLGHHLRDVQAEPVLRAALAAAGWDTPPGKNRGRGIGIYDRHIGAGVSSGMIKGELDGTLTLISPTFDQGTGTHTIIRQIVAEALQIPYEQTRVIVGDTDLMPRDGGAGAGRVTNAAGNTFLKTANDLLEKLKEAAADRFECPVEEVAYAQGEFYPREAPHRRLGMADTIALAGEGAPLTITTAVTWAPDQEINDYVAQIAEVEVDPETGQFTILKVISAHDVGRVMNPITHQGQIDGGLMQGIGMAVLEDIQIEEGRVMTAHLGDYKLPTIADIPPLETVFVPANEGPAPFSGKGIGELSNVPTAAAIANAIEAAVGVRITDLPVTAEKIYFALHGGKA